MKDFEDFLSDLKIFTCKDCGSKCVYQKTWEHDVCSGCKIKDLEKQLAEKQIQLAIQELEKVKLKANKEFDSFEKSKYEGKIYDKHDVSNAYLDIVCQIDQQLDKLKGSSYEKTDQE